MEGDEVMLLAPDRDEGGVRVCARQPHTEGGRRHRRDTWVSPADGSPHVLRPHVGAARIDAEDGGATAESPKLAERLMDTCWHSRHADRPAPDAAVFDADGNVTAATLAPPATGAVESMFRAVS